MIKYVFAALAVMAATPAMAQEPKCTSVQDGLTVLVGNGFEPMVTGKAAGAVEVTTWARGDAQWVITAIAGDSMCFVTAGRDFKDMTGIPNV